MTCQADRLIGCNTPGGRDSFFNSTLGPSHTGAANEPVITKNISKGLHQVVK